MRARGQTDWEERLTLYWHLDMRLAVFACIAVVSVMPLPGQLQGLRDSNEIGPTAGAMAPEFALPDQTGQRRTMESLMGPKGLVLVFFRSADW